MQQGGRALFEAQFRRKALLRAARIGSFIELADSKSADELEALSKEKKPNLFEFILEERIQQRRKILSSKYKESEEPNSLGSKETK